MRLLAGVLVLALAACASPPIRGRYDALQVPVANPSKVVATELAFARAAQEKGQWTAFREYATDDAVLFVPEPVEAQAWLKSQANPAQAVTWQPHEVWSSCDGSMAVTRGAWQRPDRSFGYFTTIWKRQKDGQYKWVLDQGDVLTEPLVEPEFVKTSVADCPSSVEKGAKMPALIASAMMDESMPAGGEYFNQTAADETLFMNFVVNGSSRQWKLWIWKDGGLTEAMAGTVEAAPQ